MPEGSPAELPSAKYSEEVCEKYSWPSEGARKPVETLPRRANVSVKSKRAASEPEVVLPKSL
jgi:hypothetical protein